MQYLFRNFLSDNAIIHAQRRTHISTTVLNHRDYHPHYEIYFYNKFDPQETIINGQEIKVNTPNVIISAPFSIHSMSLENASDNRFERNCIFFSDAVFKHFDESILSPVFFKRFSNCMFPLDEKQSSILTGIFNNMLDVTLSSAELEAYFAIFVKTLERFVTPDRRLKYGSSNYYCLNVLKYIYEHATEDVAVETISNNFHISRAKLDRDFRRFVGQSVHQAIMDCRLQAANSLLADTELTIKEVAEGCGFESEYYFYSFYKRNTGITPTEARKKFQEKKSKYKSKL